MKVRILEKNRPSQTMQKTRIMILSTIQLLRSIKKKGDDKWIGRRVVKTFGSAGDFEGIVYGVDADENKKGYRLFLIHYFDDDDGESMWPEELHR